MAIDAVSASRASAAYRREAARGVAHEYLVKRAAARRDMRIEEAKAMNAARLTPAERSAEIRPRSPAMLIDLLV